MTKNLFGCCFNIFKKKNRLVDECPICFETKELIVLKKCKHNFCKDCINGWILINDNKTNCPLCRCRISKSKYPNYYTMID